MFPLHRTVLICFTPYMSKNTKPAVKIDSGLHFMLDF